MDSANIWGQMHWQNACRPILHMPIAKFVIENNLSKIIAEKVICQNLKFDEIFEFSGQKVSRNQEKILLAANFYGIQAARNIET